MTLSFGLNSARDCLNDFVSKVDHFDQDDLNTSLANDCAIAAWTVLDWVFKSDGARLGYGELRDLQDDLKAQCPSLGYLQDIANARKHGKITKYQPKVKSTGLHRGGFSRGFSRDFDISRLVFQTDVGEICFRDTLVEARDFLESYFALRNIN